MLNPSAPPTRPLSTDAEFAPGVAAQRPYGVLYQGEYETPWDGTAVAVRAHARALAAAGIPVTLKSFSGIVVDEFGMPQSVHLGGLPAVVRAEIGDLDKTTASAYCPVIKHLVVRDAEHLKRVVIPQGAIARGGVEADILMRQHIYQNTIIYSVWERDRVDPAIAKILSRVAECWVPCHANRNMLIASGVPSEKVVVVPHPYDAADPIHRLRERRADPAWKKFYSIGRWEPRKGYAELVLAFLGAFKPSDQASLAIKYTGGKWPGYPTPEEAIQLALQAPLSISNGWTAENLSSRVHLVEGRFPRPQILKIHYKNNIYVSSSHGEAWCLPAFEAALAGNRVVYVPSGGVEDFLSQGGHVRVERGFSEAVPKSYGWEEGAQWKGFSSIDLMDALRGVSAPSDHVGTDLSAYAPDRIGALMRGRILGILSGRPEIRAEYERGT